MPDKLDIITTNLYPNKLFFKPIFDVVILDFASPGPLNFFENYKDSEELPLALKMQINEGLSYSQNLIILIPCLSDLSPILTLFSEMFSKRKEGFSIEIEAVSSNKGLEVFIIYCGKYNRISNENTVDFISNYLNNDSNFMNNIPNINHFLEHMSEKIGFQQIFSSILEAENRSCCDNETFFQRFLDLLKEKDRLSIEEQQEYLCSYEQKKTTEYNSLNKTPHFEQILNDYRIKKENHIQIEEKSDLSEKDYDFSEYTIENLDCGTPESTVPNDKSLTKYDAMSPMYYLLKKPAEKDKIF